MKKAITAGAIFGAGFFGVLFLCCAGFRLTVPAILAAGAAILAGAIGAKEEQRETEKCRAAGLNRNRTEQL